MRRLLFGLTLIALVLTAVPQAAGSVTVTSRDAVLGGQRYTIYTVAWLSDAADGSVGAAVTGNHFAIKAGRLAAIRFAPGSVTPTDLYDVTLVDYDGTFSTGDLLAGTGADRSATLGSILTFDPQIVEDGSRTLSVVVANAGNSKTGTVLIYVQTS